MLSEFKLLFKLIDDKSELVNELKAEIEKDSIAMEELNRNLEIEEAEVSKEEASYKCCINLKEIIDRYDADWRNYIKVLAA